MSVLLVNTRLSAQSLPMHLGLIKIVSVSLLFTVAKRKLLPLLADHWASLGVGCCWRSSVTKWQIPALTQILCVCSERWDCADLQLLTFQPSNQSVPDEGSFPLNSTNGTAWRFLVPGTHTAWCEASPERPGAPAAHWGGGWGELYMNDKCAGG